MIRGFSFLLWTMLPTAGKSGKLVCYEESPTPLPLTPLRVPVTLSFGLQKDQGIGNFHGGDRGVRV